MSDPGMSDHPDPAAAAARQARDMARQAIHPIRAAPVPEPPAPAPTAVRPAIIAMALAAACAIATFLLLMRNNNAPSRAPAPPTATDFVPSADENAILAAPANQLQLYHLAGAPQVLVAVFPSMQAQGEALNRVGAFAEKAGAPHDRLLDDAALAAAITAGGDTTETYYYGHDYSRETLRHFYAAAAAQNLPLDPPELALQTQLQRAGLLDGSTAGALITLPPLTPSHDMDATARAAILRHEISHGIYFTNPAYAAYVTQFWQTQLTQRQRTQFRTFLSKEGYDTTLDDLMRNETQAYLVHTADPRFFTAKAAGLTQDEATTLRSNFIHAMPAGWLRDTTPP